MTTITPIEQVEPRRYLLGDLVLDTGRRQVERNGKKLRLSKLSYHLLLALVEAAPNVLSQDLLIERVWSGRVVTPESVTQRIKLTRRALGDDAAHPRYIAVVRGEGYRLLVDVETLPPEEVSLAQGLMTELNRRRVLQVAIVYAAAAWSITEVLSFLVDALPIFPAWVKPLIAILFVVGFPVTMFLAWRFDIGPTGIRRTQATTREGKLTIAGATVLLVGATMALFYVVYPSVVDPPSRNVSIDSIEIAGNSIAVLPFTNDSGDQNNNYISEGLADSLRTRLGQVDGLQVMAPTSSRMFRGESIAVTDIAEQLRVATIVEGQVFAQGDQLRVSVQIINGRTGFQDWANSFDRQSRNLLAVQRDIAGEVVKQLLPDITAPYDATEPETMVPTAYESLLIADDNYRQVRAKAIVDTEKLERAITFYRLATRSDPNSAVAFSRLGAALSYAGDMRSAEEAITRAMAINPDISEVQYTLGLFNWRTYRKGTGEAYLRAIALNPNSADALEAYAKWIWHQKRYDEPEEFFLRALDLDQAALNRYADLGNYYGMSGMRDKALDVTKRIADKFDGASAYSVIARLHELAGDLDVAIGWAVRAQQRDPDNEDIRWMLAEFYARIGDYEAAHFFEGAPAFNLYFWERRYDEMIDLGEELVIDHPDQIQIWYGLARALLATGRFEQAIHVLESHGIPEHTYNENRRANDQEALIMYADALNQIGRVDDARNHARWMDGMMDSMFETGGGNVWWGQLYAACLKSILGEDETALMHLELLADSTGMMWYPVLRDAPCLKKYETEPVYKAAVLAAEQTKRETLNRLDVTLAQMQEAF